MLWPLKTNLVGKFPSLLTLPHTNLEYYLFCQSLLIFCVRDQFVKGCMGLLKQYVFFFFLIPIFARSKKQTSLPTLQELIKYLETK